MTFEAISVTIVAAFLSGIIATLISIYFNKKQLIKNVKIDLIRNLLGYRYQLTTRYVGKRDDFIFYLNQVLVIFNDSSHIINLLILYKKDMNDYKVLQELINAMFKNAGLNNTFINDILFNEPYIGN